MFKVYLLDANNYPTKIYDDTNNAFVAIAEPELELNGESGILIGKLTFKLLDLANLETLHLLKNTIIVTQMINNVETVIFRGRPFIRDEDEYNDQDYTFEGILAALNDTEQCPSGEYLVGWPNHFKTILNRHNTIVGNSNRRIDYSKIEADDPSSYMYTLDNREGSLPDLIHRFTTEYTRVRASTMEHLKTQYVESFGGYFYIENEPYVVNSNGQVVLHNYLKYIDIHNPEQAHTNSQKIEFGKNLISIKRSANADDFATVLVPLGAQLTDIEKSWPYYQSAANWKITRITNSPNSAETIGYANPGAAIDAENGKLKTGLSTNYRVLYDVEVNPGDVFFLTTYLQGVSTDYSIAAYAVIPRDGAVDSSTLIKVGPTVRNSKDSNNNVEVKTLSLKDERIEIPTDVDIPSGMKLRLSRYATDSNNATGFLLRKFNPKYKEENVTIMAVNEQTSGTIRKNGKFSNGRDVYPDATDSETAPETYEQSKRLINYDLLQVFGPIEKTIEFPNYGQSNANNLKAKASRELERMGENIEIEVQAADLAYIDKEQELFQAYDLVPVKSEPNDIDMLLPIVKMTLPLSDPASATYTLQNDIYLSQENKRYISQMVASDGIGLRPTTTVYIGGGGSDSGGGGGGSGDTTTAVLYTFQSLSESQKVQARSNIGAVAAVLGKDLSTNDYTTAEKNKLAGIQSGAEANVQSDWNQTNTSADDYIKNKPSIPSKTSDLVNDSGFLTDSDISGKVNKSGDSMSGNLQMSMNKITSLGAPTNGNDAATKKYVDDAIIAGTSVLSPLISKSGSTWSLTTSGVAGVTWQQLFDSMDSEIMLMASDGTNTEHLWKNSVIFPAASSITSVDMYFSSQRYNGRTAEGRAFKITVHSDGSAGTITEITGADIPQNSGGSGSEPYEIPITATSSSYSTNKKGDEVYANADNCVLVVNGTRLAVISSEKYTENGSQYVRIVGAEYDSLDSSGYSFYTYEVVAENSNTYTPIVSRRHYNSEQLIRHKIFYYNESTNAVTKAEGGAAKGSDIGDALTAGSCSVYIIGAVTENGNLTYNFYEPITDVLSGSNSGTVRFSRATGTGVEILTIPANSSTATKTTIPFGGGGGSSSDAVLYTAQSLTDSQKSQARTNIGAVAAVSGKGLSTNDYTTAEKNKLASIPSGAEANVQSDWNQTDTTADDFIKNKPTIPAAQIQSDWNQTDTSAKDYIKNKPSIPASHTFYYDADHEGTWDLDYQQIGTLLANGEDVQCKITCGNSDFYAPVHRHRTQSPIGEDFYSFDVLTYHNDTDKMWWMSVHVYNANGRTQVGYYEGEFAPEAPIVYINILDDGSMIYNGSPINCDDVAAMSRNGKTIIGLYDFYADGLLIYPLYLTNADEQGAIEFTGFFFGSNNTWMICNAGAQRGDVLDISYFPVTDYVVTVNLNSDGTIRNTSPSTIRYNDIKNLLSREIPTCLLVNQDGTRSRIYSTEQMSTTNGSIVFAGPIRHANGNITEAVFLLDSSNNLTVSYTARENALRKVTDLASYYASTEYYPSVKGVWDTFQRKPVTVWEVQDVSQGLLALNTNISSSLAWQLTNLDLTPFKRIKIYVKAGRKTGVAAADSSITPASIIEMSMDDRAKETVTQNAFIASSIVQNPNDPNRLGLITCAVSGDKTKFAVLRATTLYGTAATSNTDAYPYVFMIEGYYD